MGPVVLQDQATFCVVGPGYYYSAVAGRTALMFEAVSTARLLQRDGDPAGLGLHFTGKGCGEGHRGKMPAGSLTCC